MQVIEVPALTGWKWVTEGFRLLARQPMALLGTTMLFIVTIVLPSVLPLIGGFAPLVLTPGLSAGFMQAIAQADRGVKPSPLALFDGFRANGGRMAGPLLILGVINCVLTVSVLAASMLADGGTLFRVATGAISADDPGLTDRSLLIAGLVFATLYAPVQMAMWLAPVFVAWHGIAPVKALFYSLVAVWRNRWAFLVYTIGWLAIAVLASMVIQVILSVPGGAAMRLLLTPVSLAMLCALYCSFWPTYRDIIRTSHGALTGAAPGAGATNDPLNPPGQA